jgi:oligopeptide/dipeptide ABC transporter ATP-binding protein
MSGKRNAAAGLKPAHSLKAAGTGQPILRVDDLVVRFDTVEGLIHAVNGVSFSLQPGEVLGVVGESGSGKSVTMMCLIGLIPQPPGQIAGGQAHFAADDGPVDLLALDRKNLRALRGGQIGFIFQDPISSLNPTMPIGRQIAESMVEHLHLNESEAQRHTIALLRGVGIADAENRYHSYPHEFSGGMRQRVMIAIAVACQPKLVVADEPTTALDVTVQAQILELVRALQQEMGMAVIWISHDLGVVAGLADRIAVMYGGTIVESGPADDLFERPRHPYTAGLLGAMPSVADDAGAEDRPLVSIEGHPPDLLRELVCCPFANRCRYAVERCWQERPPLQPVERQHELACFVDLATVGSSGDVR